MRTITIAVYPYVYREHDFTKTVIDFIFGLSICIQGTHLLTKGDQLYAQFIPVYTGNTPKSPPMVISVSVYPCVYREHTEISAYGNIRVGLSLCIQGTLLILQMY